MRIYITGASGFLGRHVVPLLSEHVLYHPGRCISPRDAMDFGPEVVVALAGRLGPSADDQQQRRWDYYRDNLQPHLELLSALPGSGVKHLVVAGTYGAYPASASVPFVGSEIFRGLPATSYGAAKQAAMVATMMFGSQHPITVSYLLFANLYGPGQQECRVVPSLMRKVPAGEVLRGTGNGTREFLYVTDAAWAVAAAVRVRHGGVLNIGTGVETRIGDLAAMFGTPRFDGDASADSRMVMRPDIAAKELLGWHATTTLRDGLEWCKSASPSPSGAAS